MTMLGLCCAKAGLTSAGKTVSESAAAIALRLINLRCRSFIGYLWLWNGSAERRFAVRREYALQAPQETVAPWDENKARSLPRTGTNGSIHQQAHLSVSTRGDEARTWPHGSERGPSHSRVPCVTAIGQGEMTLRVGTGHLPSAVGRKVEALPFLMTLSSTPRFPSARKGGQRRHDLCQRYRQCPRRLGGAAKRHLVWETEQAT